jgi:hypothetical protein
MRSALRAGAPDEVDRGEDRLLLHMALKAARL